MNPLTVFKYVPLSVLRAMALFVAKIMNTLPNLRVKHIIDINLRLAYPELTTKDRQQLNKDILRNQSLSSVESIKSWAMPPEWSMNQIHTVYNQEVILKGLKDPKGMLAIVPHLGTWEIMNAWINQFGSPTIMFKPIKNKMANTFILQGRERLNAQLVPTDAAGVKAIFKTLKQGGFSIVLPDHVPRPSGGVNVPFFGVETLTSTLAPKLASKTKCALVGLICVRRDPYSSFKPYYRKQQKQHMLTKPNNKSMLFADTATETILNPAGSFDIHCIELNDPALYDRDITIATAALNQTLQQMITPFPSHYLWGYKRFKNMPIIKNPYKLSKAEIQSFLSSKNHAD